MSNDKIISKPIYDKNGKIIGNLTGRREHVEPMSQRDIHHELQKCGQKDKKNASR